jgi:hypothetical protein
MWPLLGQHEVRGAILPAPEDLELRDVIASYQRALAEGDVETIVGTFEPDGYFRGPAGGAHFHSGTEFPDKCAVLKLCEIILNDDEPNVRYDAAEALTAIGDETAIPALEYVKEHDVGTDYEGRPVSDMAECTIQGIYKRSRGKVDNP